MRISSDKSLPSDAAKIPKGKIKSLRQVFGYLAPYKTSIIFAALALLFTSGSVLGMGKGLSFLVDQGISKRDMSLLNEAYAVLLGIVILLAFATCARYFLVTWIGERVVADIRRDVYSHLIKLDCTFFETNRTGELLSRLTTDTTLLQTVIGSSVSIALRNILLLFGGCTMLIITSLRLSEYVFIVIPLIVYPIVKLGKKVRVLSRETQEQVANLSVHAEETISSIHTIQSLSLESYETERFSGHVANTLSTALKRIKLRSLLTAIVILLVFGAVATIIWVGGRDVVRGEITPGELSSFIFYAMIVAGSTGAISEVIGDLQRAAGATERLMELKAEIVGITAPETPTPVPNPVRGEIILNDIHFNYPSRPDDAALTGVSLSISPGEQVALVGPSGAGKSTILHLLQRVYDPQSGSISLDGIDLKAFDPQEMRKQMALVPQDPVIFTSSAYDNIRIGNINATKEEVLDAARQAEALEFIEALPDGMDSFLGEKGIRLSGGQRQRLAIARAIIRNPKILLLDEATSALDSENEQKVQHALEALMKNRTTLVIAHRLATVQNADRIIVLNEGKIEAVGTHDQLLTSSPLYARLAKLQFDK